MLRYSGSPLAYSFSEQHHAKSTVLVDLSGPTVSTELIAAPVPRRLADVTGTLDELLARRAARRRLGPRHGHRRAPTAGPVPPRPGALPARARGPARRRDGVPAAPRAAVVTAAHDPLDVAADFLDPRHRPRPDARRGRRAAPRVRGRRGRRREERLMHLRSLTLQAIGPFAGRHTIDFGALAQGGLFLLEGPTGSGKSTVIDAIVFALYGKVASAEASEDRLRSAYATGRRGERGRPRVRGAVRAVPGAAHARVPARQASRQRDHARAARRSRPGGSRRTPTSRRSTVWACRSGPAWTRSARRSSGSSASTGRSSCRRSCCRRASSRTSCGPSPRTARTCCRRSSAPRCTSGCRSGWPRCAARATAGPTRPASCCGRARRSWSAPRGWRPRTVPRSGPPSRTRSRRRRSCSPCPTSWRRRPRRSAPWPGRRGRRRPAPRRRGSRRAALLDEARVAADLVAHPGPAAHAPGRARGVGGPPRGGAGCAATVRAPPRPSGRCSSGVDRALTALDAAEKGVLAALDAAPADIADAPDGSLRTHVRAAGRASASRGGDPAAARRGRGGAGPATASGAGRACRPGRPGDRDRDRRRRGWPVDRPLVTR